MARCNSSIQSATQSKHIRSHGSASQDADSTASCSHSFQQRAAQKRTKAVGLVDAALQQDRPSHARPPTAVASRRLSQRMARRLAARSARSLHDAHFVTTARCWAVSTATVARAAAAALILARFPLAARPLLQESCRRFANGGKALSNRLLKLLLLSHVGAACCCSCTPLRLLPPIALSLCFCCDAFAPFMLPLHVAAACCCSPTICTAACCCCTCMLPTICTAARITCCAGHTHFSLVSLIKSRVMPSCASPLQLRAPAISHLPARERIAVQPQRRRAARLTRRWRLPSGDLPGGRRGLPC